MNFIESIKARAKMNKKTVVLPESTDIRTIKAARMATDQDIANIILIGNESEIAAKFPEISLEGIKTVNPLSCEYSDNFANKFYELRKNKGVELEKAKLLMRDNLYFGVMMVKEGIADGMVAGAVNSTSNVLRPSLQILKTAKGTKLVSAFFIMVVPDYHYGENGVLLYADSGLVENPDAESLSEIAVSSAKSFETLIEKPAKVAMLSYSTYGSAKSPLTEKVIEATRLAKEKCPYLHIDGELQVDAAIVPAIGKSKAPGSNIAGEANVLIFPDLNSGNIAYKLTERLAKAEAYGPITQGIAKPVNDLSRGCKAEDIVGVIAITAVQAL